MTSPVSGRTGLGVRGDSLYCPLAFSLDPYFNCEPDCHHCYLRGLNHTWGRDLRPISLDELDRKLTNGVNNQYPSSPLAHCLARKKTMRVGNKSDPFQPAEKMYQRTRGALLILRKHRWSHVIQTRFTELLLEECGESIAKSARKGLVIVMPVISPGLDKDWRVFERGLTTPISRRLFHIRDLIKMGVPVGINGEPFIPGYHTVFDFENAVKVVKSLGVKRYNTYNFHFTPFIAKRIHGLPGVDIGKIWTMNQDRHWRPLLQHLLDIAKKYDITLGCPDFVNSGPDWIEGANTCCGLDVPNPTTFNTHYFKMLAQQGFNAEQIEEMTWDGSGDLDQGRAIIRGDKAKFYTLKDAGVI